MKAATLLLLAALGAAYPANQAKDDRPEVALQAAIKKEAVDGDLKGAIEQYRKIAQSSNRAVAAKALVHMGQCYEKLGDAEAREARKAYERVVREFADQKEAVEQARGRLAAKGRDARSETGVVARQVSADVNAYPSGLSPDGRYLSFEDGETGDVAIRDLTTGEKRRLTNKGSWAESWQETGDSAFSPDGKQVAYGWWVPKPNTGELRLIGLDGSAPRVVYRNAESDWVDAYAWSPDGKQVLAVVYKSATNFQIVWISVADGSARLVKTGSASLSPHNLRLSPDARYIAYDYAPKEGSAEIFLLAADGSQEVPLTKDPANDRSPVWTPDGKSIVFLSDRTGSTAAWRIEIAEGRPQKVPQLLKQNLGRSTLLGFTPRGLLYYGVDTGTEDIYAAGVDFTTGKVMTPPERVVSRFVGSNREGRWSPDGQFLAYCRRGSLWFNPESPAIRIRSVKTGEERQVAPKLSHWPWYISYSWSADSRFFFLGGYGEDGRQGIYRAEVETGEATPVVLAKPGEFLESPGTSQDGKVVFLRKATASGGEWYGAIVVRDLEGRESELARGLVETIAVSPDGGRVAATIAEPGRGTVLKVLPTDGGGSREVFRIEKEKGAAVGNSLGWSADGRFVLFGWQPKTGVPENELWVIPAEGGKPQKLDLPTKQMLLSPHAHPDGRRIAFTAGTPFRTEIWAMDNLLPAPKASR